MVFQLDGYFSDSGFDVRTYIDVVGLYFCEKELRRKKCGILAISVYDYDTQSGTCDAYVYYVYKVQLDQHILGFPDSWPVGYNRVLSYEAGYNILT
jgi:hypothetical protein